MRILADSLGRLVNQMQLDIEFAFKVNGVLDRFGSRTPGHFGGHLDVECTHPSTTLVNVVDQLVGVLLLLVRLFLEEAKEALSGHFVVLKVACLLRCLHIRITESSKNQVNLYHVQVGERRAQLLVDLALQ